MRIYRGVFIKSINQLTSVMWYFGCVIDYIFLSCQVMPLILTKAYLMMAQFTLNTGEVASLSTKYIYNGNL